MSDQERRVVIAEQIELLREQNRLLRKYGDQLDVSEQIRKNAEIIGYLVHELAQDRR